MPCWSPAPLHIARALVLFGLSVGPSQAASNQQSSEPDGKAVAFTRYAVQTLSNDVKHALRLEALNQALEQRLLLESERQIPPEALVKYHREHEQHFQKPEAIAIWRLLASSETQAKELLSTIQKSPDPVRTWGTLVREHSLDKATHFRRGSLGYVWPDGNTDVPQVRVAPALFEAAKSPKDGELLPLPIREGQYWALVWRRDTRAATARPLDQVQAAIRQQLSLSQARTKYVELAAQLRSLYLTDYHPERLDSFSPGSDVFNAPARPPIAARPADRSPVPRETDLGER